MNAVNPINLKPLRELFGDRCETDQLKLKRYSADQVGNPAYEHMPGAVVFPDKAEEIAALMRWANEFLVPVTPRGAGSGLAGGAVPVEGGVVCSLNRMNRLLEIDLKNLMAVVEPGLVTNQLDKKLRESGLFFAGYPMSEDICFIGGNVATNAGGGRAIKYGVTSRYITGAEVVTPTGEILTLGGKRLKDVGGYNLLPLFLGSEGTLGIFSKITIRLIRRPREQAVLLAGFPTAISAANCVGALQRDLPNLPSALEYMDGETTRKTCESMRDASKLRLNGSSTSYLLIEYDGDRSELLKGDMESAEKMVLDNGGTTVQRGETSVDNDQIWKLRKQIPWFVKKSSGSFHSLEDVAVPPAEVPELVAFTETLRSRYNLPIALFGHAGDGNFHVTPMKPDGMSPDEWYKREEELLNDLYEKVITLDGTISGEHGIGRKRADVYCRTTDSLNLSIMRSIKKQLDPEGVLNLGVIFRP